MPQALRPDVLALPIDYSTSITAETANGAALLLSDDVGAARRLPRRALGRLAPARRPGRRTGWPTARRRGPAGQIVVANLGVGAHDVVFGSAVLARAEREGIGDARQPVSARRAASRSSGSGSSA